MTRRRFKAGLRRVLGALAAGLTIGMVPLVALTAWIWDVPHPLRYAVNEWREMWWDPLDGEAQP